MEVRDNKSIGIDRYRSVSIGIDLSICIDSLWPFDLTRITALENKKISHAIMQARESK
jgi:hypothetical protein